VPCAPMRLFAPLNGLIVRECGDLKLRGFAEQSVDAKGRAICNRNGCSCFERQLITTSHW
jgi:hypothetical protein